MKLSAKLRYFDGFKTPKLAAIRQYRNDDDLIEVNVSDLTPAMIDSLYDRAKADLEEDPQAPGARGLLTKITSYRNVLHAPEGKKIGKLELLETALRAYIEPSPHKWLFGEGHDGFPVPYYVRSIRYSPSTKDHPAEVVVQLAALARRSNAGRSIYFRKNDLGRSVREMLGAEGYFLENEATVEGYLKDMELYKELCPKTGMQFRCVGTGFPISYYGHGTSAMVREGVPAKVVMDDEENEDTPRGRDDAQAFTTNEFWTRGAQDENEDDEATDAADTVVTPVHPYVKVFDLEHHEFVTVHVRNLTPYVYDKDAAGKLVLDNETKELVTILVRGAHEVMEDIVAGKTGGTIVISTGPPGTGKTLTAEVFSEEIECPLYTVQCSQLGTDEEHLEKSLLRVLTRAARWKAILLIDEADVYVHTRGTDIQQNAIVGVFLRVLERYRGVLFLTSNREVIIDDAILSRASAWIRYEYPDREKLRQLWKVLSAQYRMEMSDKAIEVLCEAFPKLSGRNIKNLLKLAGKLVRRKTGQTISVDLFKRAARFLDLPTPDKSGQ